MRDFARVICSAMARRRPSTGISSTRVSGGRCPAACGCSTPRKTASRSACSIRPAGPVPRTSRRLIPASNARRRSEGEASGRSLVLAGCRRCAWRFGWRRGWRCGRRRLGSDHGWPRRRHLDVEHCRSSAPTGTMSPAAYASPRTVPATGLGSSTVALSVSTSASTESGVTWSPTVDEPLDELGLGDALADVGQLRTGARRHARPPSTRVHRRGRRGPGPGSTTTRGRAGYGVSQPRHPCRSAPRGGRTLAPARARTSSAPKPDVSVASWTTTQRPVFSTDATIVSTSSGTSVRRSMISASMPDRRRGRGGDVHQRAVRQHGQLAGPARWTAGRCRVGIV